ncbi:uncharacterized protein LOC106090475 isoform X1 [Stomoxys calcitrans]|uniref:uncharacterized protein LOC106090475 isoform X1 n=1 Tax=Stomoxys calcitrans TaxID=35570 RepID=UPI0027E359E3|nr:uncharacterized protein LOC106090475 isoform X1 [Stomoxys calcitrans]
MNVEKVSSFNSGHPREADMQKVNVDARSFNAIEFLANSNVEVRNPKHSPPKTPIETGQSSSFTPITPVSSRFNANDLFFVAFSQEGVVPTTPKPIASPTLYEIRLPRQLSIPVHYQTPASSIDEHRSNTYRMPFSVPSPQISQHFPKPIPPPTFVLQRLNKNHYDIAYESPTLPALCHGLGPVAMLNGTIQVRLRCAVRIDMTLDRAVRVYNHRTMVAIALSNNCNRSAVIQPNGRVLQMGNKVEIVTYDAMQSNNYVRYAKMWHKGISFTSESCALTYLVDTLGTRTITDSFTKSFIEHTKDYTLVVFYENSRHGPSYFGAAKNIVANCVYSCTDEGTEMYDINGFHIVQTADGLVKITRNNKKCFIRTSPANGSSTLTTASVHCTGSLGQTSHLFVRRNEKRMHFDGLNFVVRNCGHSAGFNEENLLIVY